MLLSGKTVGGFSAKAKAKGKDVSESLSVFISGRCQQAQATDLANAGNQTDCNLLRAPVEFNSSRNNLLSKMNFQEATQAQEDDEEAGVNTNHQSRRN